MLPKVKDPHKIQQYASDLIDIADFAFDKYVSPAMDTLTDFFDTDDDYIPVDPVESAAPSMRSTAQEVGGIRQGFIKADINELKQKSIELDKHLTAGLSKWGGQIAKTLQGAELADEDGGSAEPIPFPLPGPGDEVAPQPRMSITIPSDDKASVSYNGGRMSITIKHPPLPPVQQPMTKDDQLKMGLDMAKEIMGPDVFEKVMDIAFTPPHKQLPKNYDSLPYKAQQEIYKSILNRKKGVYDSFLGVQKALQKHFTGLILDEDLSNIEKAQLQKRVGQRAQEFVIRNGYNILTVLDSTLGIIGREARATLAPLTRTSMAEKLGIPRLEGSIADVPKIILESGKPLWSLVAPFVFSKKFLQQDTKFLHSFDFTAAYRKEEEFLRSIEFDKAMKVEPSGMKLSKKLPWLFSDDGEGIRFKADGWADITEKGAKGFLLDVVSDPIMYFRPIPKGNMIYFNNGENILYLNKRGDRIFNKWVQHRTGALERAGMFADKTEVETYVKSLLSKKATKDIAFAEKIIRKPGIEFNITMGLLDTPAIQMPVGNITKIMANPKKYRSTLTKVMQKALYAQHGLEDVNKDVANMLLTAKGSARRELVDLLKLTEEAMKYSSPETKALVFMKLAKRNLRQISSRERFGLVASGKIDEAVAKFGADEVNRTVEWMKGRKKDLTSSKRATAAEGKRFAMAQEIADNGHRLDMGDESAQNLYDVLTKMADSKSNMSRYAAVFPEYDKSLYWLDWIPGIRSDSLTRSADAALSAHRLKKASGARMKRTEGEVLEDLLRRSEAGEMVDPISLMYRGQVDFVRDMWRYKAAKSMQDKYPLSHYASRAVNKTPEQLRGMGWKQLKLNNKKHWVPGDVADAVEIIKVGNYEIALPTHMAEAVKPIFNLKGSFFSDIGKNADEFYKSLVNGLDDFTAIWAQFVTIIWPSFHTRNVVTEFFNSFLDRGLGVFFGHYDAMKLRLGKKFKLTSRHGTEFNSIDELKYLVDEGVISPMQGQTKMSYKDLEEVINLEAHGALARTNDWVSNNPVFKLGRTGQQTMDEHMKVTTYLWHLRKTGSRQEALAATRKFHADYVNKLNTYERRFLKRLFPFYTFSKFNTPLQATQIYQNPGRQMLPIKVLKALSDEMSEEERRTEPSWFKGQFVFPIDQRNGETKYAVVTGLPITEAFGRFFALGENGSLSPTAAAKKAIFSMTNPIYKGFIELSANRNFFFGSKIYPDKPNDPEVFTKAPPLIKHLPEEVKNLLPIRIQADPNTGKTYYEWKGKASMIIMYLLQQSFAGRAFAETGRTLEEYRDAGAFEAGRNFISPVRTYNFPTKRKLDRQFIHEMNEIKSFVNDEISNEESERLGKEIENYGKVKTTMEGGRMKISLPAEPRIKSSGGRMQITLPK